MQEPLLTHAEVAALLGVSKRTVRRAWYRGDLPSPFYIGRSPRWTARTMNRYITDRQEAVNRTWGN
jgi:excisionase family DNA binding protein